MAIKDGAAANALSDGFGQAHVASRGDDTVIEMTKRCRDSGETPSNRYTGTGL
jgi:hypothetical protein